PQLRNSLFTSMEHYNIGKTVHISEPPDIPGQLPVLSSDSGVADSADSGRRFCLLMQVKPGSKAGRLVDYAVAQLLGNADADVKSKPKLHPIDQVLWTGDGDALEKAISCSEMTKRRCDSRGLQLHQANCLFYQKMRQFYEPKLPGLDRLQAVREVPAIRCLLSRLELPASASPLPAGSDFAAHFVSSVLPAEAGRQRAAPVSNPAKRHVTKVKARKGAKLLLSAKREAPSGEEK
ncbi:hypothetical protein BOX15_Mlig030989g2, partial [Macrostomum lignano]